MRHPNNGPTFSKATQKKREPLSDTELADRRARQAAGQAQAERDAARSREAHETLHREGIFGLMTLVERRKNR